jgi:ABC-type branched-subunit amino acid transport system substrate-binding protein
MITARRAVIGAAALLVTATTLVACSGTSGGDGGGTAAPGGDPISFMIQGQFTGENPYLTGQQLAQAEIDRVNADGGVNGRQLKPIFCDNKRDANLAAQCARQAVQESVAAYIDLAPNFDDVTYPVLEAAGIPYIKGIPTLPMDLSSPGIWNVFAGAIAYGGASGVVMADDGCKKVGSITYESASSQYLVSAIKVGYESNGGKGWLDPITTPVGTPDYVPTVASIISQGADCLGLAIPPADTLKVGQALAAAGSDIQVYAALGVISPQVVEDLNGSVKVTVFSDFPVLAFSNDDPSLADYHADTKSAGVEPDSYGANGWWSTAAFIEILKLVEGGEYTAETVKTALGVANNIELPGTQPIDFTKQFDVKGYERLFNTFVHVSDADGPDLVERPDLADVSAFFKAFAAANGG